MSRDLNVRKDLFEKMYERKPCPSLSLLIARLVWPQFVEIHGLVLLADQVGGDLAFVEKAIADAGPDRAEGRINTVYLDQLFGGEDSDETFSAIEAIGRILEQTWSIKAKQDFPSKDFVARFDYYSEEGDPGIVITQAIYAHKKQGTRQGGVKKLLSEREHKEQKLRR